MSRTRMAGLMGTEEKPATGYKPTTIPFVYVCLLNPLSAHQSLRSGFIISSRNLLAG